MILVAALSLAAMTVTAAVLQREQIVLSDKLIRLHVVANSNTDEDQGVKLMVRDAVLKTADSLLLTGDDPESILGANLPLLQETAEECLRSNGFMEPVEVSLKMERFPTRVYDSFSLPGGVYKTLRVTIGSGAGENWWCVVFPAICLRAAGEFDDAAAAAGFSQGEIRLITEDNQGYILKFKVLELLEKIQRGLVS